MERMEKMEYHQILTRLKAVINSSKSEEQLRIAWRYGICLIIKNKVSGQPTFGFDIPESYHTHITDFYVKKLRLIKGEMRWIR